MPYSVNQGVRIHYRLEGNPDGPPLVLHHGFGMSIDDWHEAGHVAALGGAYRLILLDARGHGMSDKPHDVEAHRDRVLAADAVAVLDTLGTAQAHFFGYSMGAVVGFALALSAPERFRSLILGGGGPADHPAGEPDGGAELMLQPLEKRLAVLEQWFGPWVTPGLRARAASADPVALRCRALGWSTARHGYEEALPRVSVPSLFFAGDADIGSHAPCKAVSARMAQASFISLPGIGHIEGFYRVDLVAPYVLAFLATVP